MTPIETNYPMSEGLSHSIELPSGYGFSPTSRLAWLERQLEKRNSRRALLELSDDLLKDIGKSRFEADREARRRFRD